ncbi:MAG: Ig-like domain-containing protein [Myxococcota bacterium]
MACSGNDLGGDKTPQDEIVVSPGSVRLDEDTSAPVVLSAETDAGPLTYEIVTQPLLGQLVGAGSQWEYVPDPDANGEDAFTWHASAGGITSEDAVFTIVVDPVNDAPVGVATQIGTNEDTPVHDRLTATDVEGDPLVFALVTAPEAGRVDLDPTTGEFTYSPDLDYTGQDAFVWSAFDPAGASTGPVRVDLNVADANDPPEVEPGAFVLAEDTTLDAALVAVDPDGDPLTWRVYQQVSHGQLTLNNNLGTFTYAPWPDYYGPDTFTVVANDGTVDSEPVTLSLTVTGVNDAPTVPPAVLEVDEDAVRSATVAAGDVEGDPLAFRVDSPPHDGALTLDPVTGAITYTPSHNWSGVDEFTIVASDTHVDSLPGRVTVVVQPVNDPPTASGGGLLLTNEDTSVAGAIRGADPENDALTFVLSTAPAHGTVTLSPSAGDFVYSPSLDYNGADTFSIVASDGQATSGEALVSVQVLSINDAPRLTPSTLTAVQDSTTTMTLPAVDPEGDLLYFLVQTPPQHGTAVLDSLSGELAYTPTAGYAGADVLIYAVSDGVASSTGILPITVSADGDGDGVPHGSDNCPDVANDGQSDVNGNGLGDACDCWSTPFSATLDPSIWTASALTSAVTSTYVSPSHSRALLGDGAYLQAKARPGCAVEQYALQVALGSPAPELTDSLVLSARVDGGPWVVVDEVFGTGVEESFDEIVGNTEGLGLVGDEIEWMIEVVADEVDDVFTIDDFSVACDTDADWLPDCVETFIDGYDLTVADADGDGWLDGDEYAAGSDPYLADTDFDGIDDPVDNCPTTFNPSQTDSDGNGFGDACDLAVHDDFSAGVLDPSIWVGLSGDAAVTTEFAYNDLYSLRLSGGGGWAEALPIDFSGCPEVAWYFQLKPGPEPPDSTDHFQLQFWNGTAWINLIDRAGQSLSTTVFEPTIGSSIDPSVLSQGARIRFNAPTTTSGTGYDEWFIDDVAIGCDFDGDDLPTWAEQKIQGTNPFVADTDGDGVNDGAEVVAGTDPLDSTSH